MTSVIRILVGEKHAVIREGLKQIVAANRDMVVAGEAGDGQKALDEVSNNHYDVAILDISLPGRSWLDVLKELRRQKLNFPVLILSAHADEDQAIRAFRAGASGYLTTECAPDELLAALRKVLSGGKYVGASLGERLASNLENGTGKPLHELLSDREYQVMGLLASGRTVSEIADEMFLSVKTISTYRSRVLEKLDLKNNVDLARYWTRSVDTRTVQCRKCGQDNPQVAKFCARCGGVLDATAELSQPASSTPLVNAEIRRKHANFRAKSKWLATVLAVGAVVTGIIVWRNQPASTSYVAPKEVELRYDDGKAESTVGSSRGGYLVSFSPPSVPFIVNKIRMYGETYTSERTEFELQIWDQEQKVLHSASYPFTLFPPSANGPAWIEVSVPDVEVKTDFFIHLYTGTGSLGGQNGVQLGADDSTRNRHSSLTILTTEGTYKIRDGWGYYIPSKWFADKDKVNWMIRVVGRNTQ